ncbi:MAG: hypothetical protein NUV67_05415 [archaeon]|nr:hypothetical protein [archaeon]
MIGSKKVALDTNILLAIVRNKVDVFAQCKQMFGRVDFLVPQQVVSEMEMLAKKNKAIRKEVNIAMELMEKNNAQIVENSAKNADLALLELAKVAAVATNDKELKASVKELNGKVLHLRQGKFLELN